MKIKPLSGVLLVSTLIVSGCSGDEASGKAEAEESYLDTPEGVENGLMSQEFYEDVYDFFMGYEDFKYEQNTYVVSIDPDFASLVDLELRKEIAIHAESFIGYLDSVGFKGETELENEMTALLNKFIEEKKNETELIETVPMVYDTYPGMYDLLQSTIERNDKLEDEIYSLLEDNKISPNH